MMGCRAFATPKGPQLLCLRYARNDGCKLSSQLRVRIRIMKLSKLNSATCIHISESVR